MAKRKPYNKQADPAYHKLEAKSPESLAHYAKEQRSKSRFKKAKLAEEALDKTCHSADGARRIYTGVPDMTHLPNDREPSKWVETSPGRLVLRREA